MSLCSAVCTDGAWQFGAQESATYELISHGSDTSLARATLLCRFENGKEVKEHYTVGEDGVSITAEGDGEIGFALPALCFDGECSPEILLEKNTLHVLYEGWECRYTVSGEIRDTDKIAANRNGHYRVFLATAQGPLNIKIEILQKEKSL